jgi:transcriptional regulator with PAS, ATPase and Fis domain
VRGPPLLGAIVGESVAMRRAREMIRRYAPTTITILLVGATGTGKELVARHIHTRSDRRGRFVGVNCGALPREMAEGLLFGYDRGAFSGAVKRHRGHLECADGGTLFLDELLSLPLEGQAKLLRALDTGEIQRLGEETERYVDMRAVAAVQEDVLDCVASGAFRRDLYHRLAAVVIELPPLADRLEDIVPLAEHFAAQQGQRLQAGTGRELTSYAWPGNVRELRQVIERAGRAVEDGTLPPAAVRDAIVVGVPRSGASARDMGAARSVQYRELFELCEGHGWDTRRAAASLGIARSTLYYRLKVAGMSPRALRKEHLKFHWNSMEFQRRAHVESR